MIQFGHVFFLYLILIDLIIIVVAISGRMLLDWQPLNAFYPIFYGAQLGLALALIGLLQMLLGLFKKQKTHFKDWRNDPVSCSFAPPILTTGCGYIRIQSTYDS